MRWSSVVVVVALCGCHDLHGDADAVPASAVCGATSGSVVKIADGAIAGMDATRLFIYTGSSFEAVSKVDGTLTVLDVPADTGAYIIVNDIAFGVTSTGDSLLATNLDDGTQSTVTLAQPERVERMTAAPNGELFVTTTDTIQQVDPGATSSRVVVTAPAMTSIIGTAASNDALVWIESDPSGQHLKKMMIATGTVVRLNDVPYATAAQFTNIALTATDVFLVEYSNPSWSLVRRRATDGQLVATYAGGQGTYAVGFVVDSANIYWTGPKTEQSGPPMTCVTWPGVQFSGLAGPGGTADESYDDWPMMTDDPHLYFSARGMAGMCCCGNNVPCNASNTCTLPDAPVNPPPVVKCYTR